jgi:hypothetical protein
MAMFSFSRAILLMSMWPGYMVCDANLCKECVEFLILATPICLYGDYFPVKHSFDKLLEVMEFLEDFGPKFQSVNPGKLTIVVNEANIISPQQI